MIFVYLAAPVTPLAGTMETREHNLQKAREYYQYLSRMYEDHAFLAPWILNCECFSETPDNVALGMKRNKAVIELLTKHDFVAANKANVPYVTGRLGAQLWLVGPRVSEGMWIEASCAKAADLRVMRVEVVKTWPLQLERPVEWKVVA